MNRSRPFAAGLLGLGGLLALVGPASRAQDAKTAGAAADGSKPPVVFTTDQDRQNMMDQLGIQKLRPGRDSDQKSPRAANYDEAKANPYPKLPEVLRTNDGRPVVTADQWWNERRPEVVELLEREVYGRVPADVPPVRWETRETREIEAGGKPAILTHIVGVVDSSACPEIPVNISMSLLLPKDVKGPVPVLMSFGWTPFEPSPFNFGGNRPGAGNNNNGNNAPRPPGKNDFLIAAGWGAATINPTTVQADQGGWQARRFGGPPADPNAQPTGAGLTRGIIGLTNHGQPRRPDQWGALRAWAWGASRGLDYLATVPQVDAQRVGIAGVSRYGKAALVAMAFDPRFHMALIGSSGAGGTKLFRRDFGENLENLASSGAYHWMAGNYLKYSADEADFGRKTADDLPVDSHMTLALCAPRLVFISHGIPERGDAHWLDHQGSFMAAIASQPVFRLLGAKDLGRTDDITTEKMPGVNEGLVEGELAWRQHDGGHTDEPNVESFIRWAEAQWARKQASAPAGTNAPPAAGTSDTRAPRSRPAAETPAHAARERTDANSRRAHAQLLEKTRQGRIDVYFEGDSITRRWGATDYPQFLELWNDAFHGWNAANFGWGGDTTHNILWRLQNGELDGVSPRVFVLQAGTNNLPARGPASPATVADVVDGLKAIVATFQARAPHATVILTGVFPRPTNKDLAPAIEQINHELAILANGRSIRFVNINQLLVDPRGDFLPGFSRDGLHLEKPGYQVWASAIKPLLTELLGPPSATDRAPPPTGDPRAAPPPPAAGSTGG